MRARSTRWVRWWTAALVATAGVSFLTAGSVSAASVTVSAPNAKGAKGSEVKVPISLAGASNLGALHVEITFDPRVLNGTSVDPGQLADGALLESNTAPGRVRFGLATGTKIDGDGEVAVVHFTVVGPKGAQTSLGVELVQAWEATPERFEVKPIVQAGRFTVTSSSSFPWWIIAVAAAVLLLLLFLLLRRRRKDEPGTPAVVSAEPPPAPPTYAAGPLPAGPPPAGPPPAGPPPVAPPIGPPSGPPTAAPPVAAPPVAAPPAAAPPAAAPPAAAPPAAPPTPPTPPSEPASSAPRAKFCPSCGTPNTVGGKFCASCGHALG